MNNVGQLPRLVMTRTPLRISFAGGGSDLPGFFKKEPGAVVSSTIDKYLYVTVKQHANLFSEQYRLNYSESEQAQNIDDIQNTIARECLKLIPVAPPLYINTIADIPSSSGLGSSSAFAVGLLHALHAFRGEQVSPRQLAEEAAYIEIDILKHPIGKQDQYATAFGGLNFIRFKPKGAISLEPLNLNEIIQEELFDHVMMFWTGLTRNASDVLAEQNDRIPQTIGQIRNMKLLADNMRSIAQNNFDAKKFGSILNDCWEVKRTLASGITSAQIDQWHQSGINAGAYGGKLCGAGGGGFLMFVAAPGRHDDIRKALKELIELTVNYEGQGSRLILNEEG